MKIFGAKVLDLKKQIESYPVNFKCIIESVDYPVCVINSLAEFVAVNEAYCKFYKYTKSELLGKYLFNILSEDLLLEISYQHDKFFRVKEEKISIWDIYTNQKEKLFIKAFNFYTECIEGKPHRVIAIKNLNPVKIEKAETFKLGLC